MSKLKNKTSLVIISIFLSFTICIFAPYELMIQNIEEIGIPFGLYAWMPWVVGIIAAIVAIIIGRFLDGKLLRAYETAVFAFACCFYVQGNFLNLKLGFLNGSNVKWDNIYLRC